MISTTASSDATPGARSLLLLVDDQPGNIQILHALFKNDHEVCMATSGADALLFCQLRQPDLILLDVVMPGMGGYAVCEELKRDPLTRHIPIIFVTGQNDPLEEARGLAAGGVDFITKPFHEKVVRARVRTHLTLKWQADRLRRQQHEMQLRHAELEAVSDASPLGLFHLDPSGYCTYANRTFELMFGLFDGKALGFGWRMALHPDELGAVARNWSGLTEANVPYNATYRFHHADGHLRLIRVRVAPVSVDGVVASYVGTVDDVTTRHAADAALAANERRLRLITDSIPALISYLDIETRYQFCNIHYRTLLGFDPQAMIGKTVREVYGDDAYALMATGIEAALSGQRISFERALVSGGLELHLQSEYVPDVEADGTVIGFYAMVTDVTQRRMAEQLLAAGEKRLRTITDNIPVSITYLDHQQRFEFANASMYAWTGATPETVLGKTMHQVMGEALYEDRRIHLERAMSGERVDFVTVSTMNNQQRYLQSTYIPDIGADGQVKGIYTLSNDITALKHTEHELRRLARQDSLTGLPNRTHLYETLELVLARNRRLGSAIAVLFPDIDHFKAVNDKLGHAKGDLVLQEFAGRLIKAVRMTDTVARLAGDEFVILLEGLRDAAEADLVAEKILTQIRKPWLLNGERLDISTSIGIAFDNTWKHSGADLIGAADAALYEAKAAGRNTFRAHLWQP
ncbi:diguanylate cyclase (GGDEF)-like protein/PAS domain S-box-containing protein [Actimicrobium sp. GrIS 1.19]|uniref:PAS domain-containing protein n=1 Tax=Actimicrobium sp. GrIS 1.19 TaxID=3071708 RepID=UPI002DF94275|nr:diguanylate cyclase (GGDEF)-like protein/PAS domain S-box-containing protein [Actimicrobium sp. GrIS 1.19]